MWIWSILQTFVLSSRGTPSTPSTCRLPPLHPTTFLGDTLSSVCWNPSSSLCLELGDFYQNQTRSDWQRCRSKHLLLSKHWKQSPGCNLFRPRGFRLVKVIRMLGVNLETLETWKLQKLKLDTWCESWNLEIASWNPDLDLGVNLET